MATSYTTRVRVPNSLGNHLSRCYRWIKLKQSLGERPSSWDNREMPNSLDRFFKFVGGVFFVWFLVNSTVSGVRYGWDEGMYFWFCNLALCNVGLCLFFNHRGFGLGWICVALATQSFWIVDNFWRLFTGKNLFGLVEFMYQPGNPMDEFLLSHYHFYILPVGLLWLFTTKDKRILPWWAATLCHAGIFFVSWLFPENQNVNCIHRTCLPGVTSLTGPIYSILFASFICILSLGIGALLDPFIRKHQLVAKKQTYAARAFAMWCLATIPFFYLDVRERSTIPKFHCETHNLSPKENVRCRFTLEGAPQTLELHYDVSNLENKKKVCQTLFRIGDIEKPSPDKLAMAPLEKRKVTTFFSYPKSEMTVTLSLDCREKEIAKN